MNYFDLHCDTITECYNHRLAIKDNTLQLSLDKGQYINHWIQTYAIWIEDMYRGEIAYKRFNEVYHYFLEQLEVNKSSLQLCVTAEQMKQTVKSGKRGAILAFGKFK